MARQRESWSAVASAKVLLHSGSPASDIDSKSGNQQRAMNNMSRE